MLTLVDNLLNRITMYRLVLYFLIVLVGAAAIMGFLGIMPQSPENLAFSVAVILATCWLTNKAFAAAFGAQTNVESIYITSLILTLIISPVASNDFSGVGFLVYASAWAMASKYLFAINKKHLFNPAAFGVAISALTIGQSATWWVAGNLPMLPLVFFGGLLIVRKLRRFDLVLTFAAAALATVVLTAPLSDALSGINQTLLRSPFFFFAFVMLTEPLTMPPDWLRRVPYGILVGILFSPNVHVGSFYLTPELALLIGNFFSWAVSPKGRYMLTLIEKNKLADGTFEFVFKPDKPLRFRPGQYLEWTLGHRYSDNRGNRRFFTIASAPDERVVRLGVKFYEPMSSFKRTLMAMRVGERISAAHLSGDFTLPRNSERKLAFIAGGIGVTPFRSMATHLLALGDKRDVALFYANKTAGEIAYKELFDRAARELGHKVVYTVNEEKTPQHGLHSGMLDAALIARELPDYRERTFYISGPHGMVDSFKETLREMGVPRWHIKSDYFPGYA